LYYKHMLLFLPLLVNHKTFIFNIYIWAYRRHLDTLRQGSNRRQMIAMELDTQHKEQFCDWYRDYVRCESCIPNNDLTYKFE
jgi:hypothetical protein